MHTCVVTMLFNGIVIWALQFWIHYVLQYDIKYTFLNIFISIKYNTYLYKFSYCKQTTYNSNNNTNNNNYYYTLLVRIDLITFKFHSTLLPFTLQQNTATRNTSDHDNIVYSTNTSSNYYYY